MLRPDWAFALALRCVRGNAVDDLSRYQGKHRTALAGYALDVVAFNMHCFVPSHLTTYLGRWYQPALARCLSCRSGCAGPAILVWAG